MYFVVETKGSTDYLGLRPTEQAKIDCGRKHFEAIGENVGLEVAKDYKGFKEEIVG